MPPALISGTSHYYAMIGHPVAQVRTPTVLNGYLVEHGIDAVTVTFDLVPAAVTGFFTMLRGWQNCRGCGVTIPHKQVALTHCDAVSDRARRIGAVNMIRREADGRLIGDMTDGLGFLAALDRHGVSVANRRFVLIGAGGAGSAIAHAVADNGAAHLAVIDIDAERRDSLIASLQRHYPGTRTTAEAGEPDAIDILANATPLGMRPDDPLPFPLDGIRPETLVADAVTKPPTTPFLAAARSRGCVIQRGTEMAEAQLPIFIEKLGVHEVGQAAATNLEA